MLLSKYKEDSYYFSGETTKLVNQFALAGIAIMWLFKTDKPNFPIIPKELISPLFSFVVSLSCSLFQNFIPSVIWSMFYIYHEYKNSGNTNIDIKANWWLSFPGWFFYFMKVISLFTGYLLIALYLARKINL